MAVKRDPTHRCKGAQTEVNMGSDSSIMQNQLDGKRQSTPKKGSSFSRGLSARALICECEPVHTSLEHPRGTWMAGKEQEEVRFLYSGGLRRL